VKRTDSLMFAVILLVMPCLQGYALGGYWGMDSCLTLGCHSNKRSFAGTMHIKMVQGPPTDTETPVLQTIIDGRPASIFDPRTDGYDTYIAPWADYFNEDNVAYTIGSAWRQQFMTQVIPETIDGRTYSGFTNLTGNNYAVMGAMWNVQERRWEDFNGPTGQNDWFSDQRLTGKECAGCHTTGFNPEDGTWAEIDSGRMTKGVNCESCHGPGGRMVNPLTELDFRHRFELCGACHSRGRSVAADGGAGPYPFAYNETLGRVYELGDELDDFFIQSTSPDDFWPNGNSRKNHQQYNDSLLSRHTDAEVGCILCHTTHEVGYSHHTRRPGNRLCTHCHKDLEDTTAYRRHSAHNPDVARCIDCHMPYTARSANEFDIRSHTFKIIPPAETIAQGGDPEGFSGPLDPEHIPNSCNSSCHNGLGPGPLKTNSFAGFGLRYIRTLTDLGILSGNWLKEDR